MSDKVDAILASGCLEKLLEEAAPEIKDKEGMITYLAENGFSDIPDDDLGIIKEEITKMLELNSALDESGAGDTKGCYVNYCDLRVKEAIAPLHETVVKNELSEIAFFVKDLKN